MHYLDVSSYMMLLRFLLPTLLVYTFCMNAHCHLCINLEKLVSEACNKSTILY